METSTSSICRIEVLGTQLVNGRRSNSAKTLEFIVALALGGGERRKASLLRSLYDDCAAKSAIPTLAYRARQLGVGVDFITDRDSYRLVDPIAIDALELMAALRRGDVRAALSLYRGPCLAGSHSPLAVEIREWIDQQLADAIRAAPDQSLLAEALTRIDLPALETALILEHRSATGPSGAPALP